MDPEKPQESRLDPPQIICTSSAQYPGCTSIKRKTFSDEIDPAIVQAFAVDFDVLPLIEAKIHNYKYLKHVSLETNDLLKCRWRGFRDCLGSSERVPFKFPSADDYHFYNYQTRYMPTQSIAKNKDHRKHIAHDKFLDEVIEKRVPNELHFTNETRTKLKTKKGNHKLIKTLPFASRNRVKIGDDGHSKKRPPIKK